MIELTKTWKIFYLCIAQRLKSTYYLTKAIIKIIYFGTNAYFWGCAGAAPAWGTHLPLGTPWVLLFLASIFRTF